MKRSRKENKGAQDPPDATRGTPKAKKEVALGAPGSLDADGGGGGADGAKSWVSKVIKALGIQRRASDKRFVMMKNPSDTRALIVRLFTKYEKDVGRFVDDLERSAEEPGFLESFLQPCLYQPEGGAADVSELSDSLFKALLVAPQVQPRLLTWMLSKLPNEDEQSDASVQRVRLMLRNLSFLSNVTDSAAFTRAFMDCLEASPSHVQREIVLAIPEVVDDKGHALTVETLGRLMEEESSFTPALLDTYASLNLSDDMLATVRNDLMGRLGSVDTEHLPILVKFLFQTTPAKGLSTVVERLRSDLNLHADLLQSHVHSQHAALLHQRGARAQSYQLLTLEAIETAMAFDEKVASAFVAAIGSAGENSDFDVWVTLILLARSSRTLRVKVDAMVKRKVVAREWSLRLMKRALLKHGGLLVNYFAAVQDLAERAVRSLDPVYTRFGRGLYGLAFCIFSEPQHQQSLMHAVLTHVGNQAAEPEVSAGLDVLLDLAINPALLKALWGYLETVLDLLAGFSRINVRKAWSVFAALLWDGNQRHGQVLDVKVWSALDMLLRKQLGNARHVYKRSGVIGAVSLLAALAVQPCDGAGGGRDDDDDANNVGVAESSTPPAHKQADAEFRKLWRAIEHNCTQEPAYMALALDELALAFQSKAFAVVPSSLPSTANEPSTLRFNSLCSVLLESLFAVLDQFVVNLDKKHVQARARDQVALRYDLNEALLNPVAVQLWDFTADARRTDQLLVLCPVLRALHVLHKIKQPDVTLMCEVDMEMLLGAPLLLYPPDTLASFADLEERVQQRVCTSIFFAINWTREVLNTYCTLRAPAARAKLLARLTHLHELEQQLELCLRHYQPHGTEFPFLPDAHDPTSVAATGGPTARKKAKTGGAAKKASAKDDDGAGGGGGGGIADGPADLLRVHALMARFRYLDLDVVRILSIPSATVDASGSASGDAAAAVAWLRPWALHALVSSVHANCEALLPIAGSRKTAAFGRVAPASVAAAAAAASSYWTSHAMDALMLLVLPAAAALNEQLGRLGQCIEGDESTWVGVDPEQRFDHDDTAALGEADDAAKRARMQLWWYVVPAQRMILDVFGHVLRWLQTTSVRMVAEEAKPFDRAARCLLEVLAPNMALEGSVHGGSVSGASSELRRGAFNYIQCFTGAIQTLPTAVSFARLLEIVALYGVDRKFLLPATGTPPDAGNSNSNANGGGGGNGERALLAALSRCCEGFLRRKWSTPVAALPSADTKTLLELFLQRSGHPTTALANVVAAMERLTGADGVDDDEPQPAAGAEGDERGGDFLLLTKRTLPMFYKTTFLALVRVLKEMDFAAPEKWSVDERQSQLRKLNKLNKLMCQLVFLCKQKVAVPVQVSALREGKLYVEQIMRALPFLALHIQSEPDLVKNMLRRVQLGTRLMQSMCAEAKSSGERTLLTSVPVVKRVLQQFVLEVRRNMEAVGLRQALTLGSLQHKDVAGNVLASQVSYDVAPSAADAEDDADGDSDADGAPAPARKAKKDNGKGKEEADAPDEPQEDEDEDDNEVEEHDVDEDNVVEEEEEEGLADST